MKKSILFITALFIIQNSFATIWHVGVSHTYTMPSQVSTLVQNGDTVEIDAGIYNSDVAKWSANNLLLKGVGGKAHLKANGNSYGGKAIWVIAGDNTTVENIEFSLCTVNDNNGAGIRQEGKNLTVRHCYFHDNEEGILAGTVNPSNILIEYTEFGYNGYGDGYSHNLYINHIDTLIFRFNYSHHTSVGHELKSRANVNFILYNRISDEATGTASRSIDLPNGGTSYLIGNVIEQGPVSQNSNIIGYGLEGLTNPSPNEVYAINNTIVNDKSNGSFFQFQTGTTLFKSYNNIIAGSGSYFSGSLPTNIDSASNRVNTNINYFAFANATQYDYHLTSNSTAVKNLGSDPGTTSTISLNPFMEYEHPDSSIVRCISGSLDIGAYEYCMPVDITETFFNKIKIFPNPATDIINIESTENINIEISNIAGQVLLRKESVTRKISINILSLKKGIYFIKVSGNNFVKIQKIIK